jgi:cbb3-type cytochrome oxidase maturation protein
MNILYFLVPMAIAIGGAFLFLFASAASSGQFDDLDTPARRILLDDESENVSLKGQPLERTK